MRLVERERRVEGCVDERSVAQIGTGAWFVADRAEKKRSALEEYIRFTGCQITVRDLLSW